VEAVVYQTLPDTSSAIGCASDERLFRLYAAGMMGARAELARRHMPMARRLAARHRMTSEAIEDLEQVAYVGLLKAIDRYEPGRGPFTGYAVPTIRGELKRHFRDHGWSLQVSRPVQENYLLVTNAVEALATAIGRSPTPRDIAAKTGLSVEQVLEALAATDLYSLPALDAPTSPHDEGSQTLGDTIGDHEAGYETVEWGTAIGPAFRALPQREQRIIHLRFVRDLNQSEIAAQIGISQMHVSRLLRRALTRLQESASHEGSPSSV